MKVVFSIGGSVIAPDELDSNFVKKLAEFIIRLSDNNQIAVVVGGGVPARKKIDDARNKGVSEAECDHVGILVTRENAAALIDELGDRANRQIPEAIADATEVFGEKILVMGGTEPGHSTDAVAALIADWTGADLFINATNVDGVYDKDPKEHDDAVLRETIAIDELLGMVKEQPIEAGKYALMDLSAVRVIQRSEIRTIFLNGRDIDNMENAIEGKAFRGTTVAF